MVHKFHLLLLNVIIKFLIRIMTMTLICFFFQIKNLIHTIPKAFAISFAVLKLRIVFPVSILFILVLDIPTFSQVYVVINLKVYGITLFYFPLYHLYLVIYS